MYIHHPLIAFERPVRMHLPSVDTIVLLLDLAEVAFESWLFLEAGKGFIET